LHRLVSAVAGLGGAIWLKEPEGGLRLACQLNMAPELLNTEIPDAQRHVRLVRGVLQGGGGRYMPPKSGTEQEGNPTQTILLLAALGTQHEVEGVVEVFQRPTVGPEVCRGNLQFLHEMSARASHWFKSRRLQ